MTWTQAETDWLLSHAAHGLSQRGYVEFQSIFPANVHSLTAWRSKLRRVRKSLAPVLPAAGVSDAREERLRWLRDVIADGKDVRVPRGVTETVTTRPSLVVLLSDMHFGELTDDGYCLAVAAQRVLSVPVMLKRRHTEPLKEIVIILAGDIVDGSGVFRSQRARLECNALEQVRQAMRALWDMLGLFAVLFPDVVIRVATVPGNHGRVSHDHHEEANWDNAVYSMLSVANEMAGYPYQVELNFKKFYVVEVNGTKGLINHKGTKHLGTPAMMKRYTGWEKRFGFDWFVHGHWHKFGVNTWFNKLVMCNGSTAGPNELSDDMGVLDPLRQGWILVRGPGLFPETGCLEWSF